MSLPLPVAAEDPGDRPQSTLEAKVRFLLRPDSYPEGASHVEARETHMSWVFLTQLHAYKLKKPIRYRSVDWSAGPSRRRNSEDEVRLNRRFAKDVYRGVVPLSLDASGRMVLGRSVEEIDWLVKMRRLPSDRMLDHLIRTAAAAPDDLRQVAEHLSAAFNNCERIAMSGETYRHGLAAEILACREDLAAPANPVIAAQLEFLERQAELFDARARQGRIIEGHGDLRAEHVCLEAQPAIIDCIEFNRDFRILDAADDLAFLALECARLGAPELQRPLLDAYSLISGDPLDARLVAFYQSYRACMRARLAVWRLRDLGPGSSPKWNERAGQYLQLAQDRIARCR